MDAIGGVFEITSTPGHGTTARLSVPLQASSLPSQMDLAETDGSLTNAATRLSGSAALRILMVDDHLLFRQGMRTMLEGFDSMQVIGETTDGVEAVHLAETLRPDVIVMDVNMPGMDGIETTRTIKAANPAVIIIGLSVSDSSHIAAAMLNAGAAAYLTKETASEQLYRVICEAIHTRYR
jgi:CheY-like chemotaxis protein